VIAYEKPRDWILYDFRKVANLLTNAKAAVLSLTTIPYQKNWADELQVVQLKREVAGTSRIEGADFTEKELDAAMRETAEQLQTRSQRQAAAAVKTYRWIAKLPPERPITEDLIFEIHRLLVTDADDDHCPPGKIRGRDENVTFGAPRHRGVAGGVECETAFSELCRAAQREFQEHDPLIQALALHYHFAAMHPFLDGNGRTARALEALMLQRTGLKDSLFIAMSNYYYEEKTAYLNTLAEVRANGHDLTPFLLFGLKGVEQQGKRLFGEIRKNVAKALYRNLMFDLFNRLRTPRKRVMKERHIEILKLLLNTDHMSLDELTERTKIHYHTLGNARKALIRDINYLIGLNAIAFTKLPDNKFDLFVRLDWPTEITETEFFKRVKQMPKAKTHTFLS
jgi:Fic family protein